MFDSQFPPGTPVTVTQTLDLGSKTIAAETVGVVEACERLPTGAWFAHGKDKKLWLDRLKLRKVDGEVTLLVLDDNTIIAKLEAAPDSGG